MHGQDKPAVNLPPVYQIGIVVQDMDRALEYYGSTFGWGPFRVRELEMKGFSYKGRRGDCRLRLARSRQEHIEIELIQVLEGETPHTDFLRRKGEGLHHLGIRVDDLEATLAGLAQHGIRPLFSHSYPDIGLHFAYLDSDRAGGVMLELIQKRSKGEPGGD